MSALGPQMTMNIDVKGVKEALAKLEKITRRDLRKAAQKALKQEMHPVLKESQRLVPKDTRSLERTGKIDDEAGQTEGGITFGAGGGKIGVSIGYGGSSFPNWVDYALYVHEDLSVYHPNGQAKFLEQPLKQALPGLPDRLVKRIRRDMMLR